MYEAVTDKLCAYPAVRRPVCTSFVRSCDKNHDQGSVTCSIKTSPCNIPFAAGGHMVQNPKYWRAKKCDKTPLGNINKEKSHFSS